MTAQRQSPTQACFQTPAAEFILEKLTIANEATHDAPARRNVEILIVTSGGAALEGVATGARLDLQRGDSVLIPAAAGAYRVVGEATIYRAGVPEPQSPGGPST
jgi:mannose-6-phosphate isomerase class I